MSADFSVIILAAGKSQRFGGNEKKVFCDIDSRAVWLYSLDRFINREDVCEIIIVIDPEDRDLVKRRYGSTLAFAGNAKLVDGGKERYNSVENALQNLTDESKWVAIHDAARPCITDEMISNVFSTVQKCGAAILAAPLSDTLKKTDDQNSILETVDRNGIWLAQTPQVFAKETIVNAYKQRENLAEKITDDAQLVELTGGTVTVVESDLTNIKITKGSDLKLAQAIMKSRPEKKRSSERFHPFGEEDMWR